MEQQIFDRLRRKEVAYTPEEKVRQTFILWLHQKRGVPMGLMASEYSFHYNGLVYRADIVIFDKSLKPIVLVECKAPSITLDRKVVEQGIRYNRVLKVDYMIFTNGKTMYVCGRGGDSNNYSFLDDIPSYDSLTKDVNDESTR